MADGPKFPGAADFQKQQQRRNGGAAALPQTKNSEAFLHAAPVVNHDQESLLNDQDGTPHVALPSLLWGMTTIKLLAILAVVGMVGFLVFKANNQGPSPCVASTQDVGGSVTNVANNNNANKAFQFGLFGDTVYQDSDWPKFRDLRSEMNDEDLEFQIHVGDTMGNQNCSDAYLNYIHGEFQKFEKPLIYTIGDNEWADCATPGKIGGGGLRQPYDSLESVRQIYFRNHPSKSLGKTTLAMTRQSDEGDNLSTPDFDESLYVENQRWVFGRVVFVTLHTTGSNDVCRLVTIGVPQEATYQPGEPLIQGADTIAGCEPRAVARRKANIAWLAKAFQFAKTSGALGVVIATQVDLRFDLAATARVPQFNEYLVALFKEARDWPQGQVLFVHGDLHTFKADQPMPGATWPINTTGIPVVSGFNGVLENFRRVEVPGFPQVQWVRAKVDVSNPNLFDIEFGQPLNTPPGRRDRGAGRTWYPDWFIQ
jgi:hypothetical protein